jgi:hydroxyacylglutathione hydrolase
MSAATKPIALIDEGLGNSSYLIDLGDSRALVLDPERDPSRYLQAAEVRGLTIAYAAETHLHADFVSGSRELAARGARCWPHRPVESSSRTEDLAMVTRWTLVG